MLIVIRISWYVVFSGQPLFYRSSSLGLTRKRFTWTNSQFGWIKLVGGVILGLDNQRFNSVELCDFGSLCSFFGSRVSQIVIYLA